MSAVTSLKEEAPNAKIVISRLLPVDGRKRHITDRRIDGTRYLDCENVRKNGGTRHVDYDEVRRDARIRQWIATMYDKMVKQGTWMYDTIDE